MKRILSLVLVIVLAFCFVGCNKTNTEETSTNNESSDLKENDFLVSDVENTNSINESTNSELNDSSTTDTKKEPQKVESDDSKPNITLTTEEDFWDYFIALYLNYDLFEANNYSHIDLEKVYQKVVADTVAKHGISKEDLYKSIQNRLQDSNVKDFKTFSAAYSKFMNNIENSNKPAESEIKSKLDDLKKRQVTSVMSDAEVSEFEDDVYSWCNEMQEAMGVDISELIILENIKEYKSVTIREENIGSEGNAVANPRGQRGYFLVRTDTGWNVFDIAAVLAIAQAVAQVEN